MTRIVKEPEVRKSEIIDVAGDLFNTRGYTGTSVNDIIEKAGIAKGTFYYYFKSKEEVLDEIVKKWVSGTMLAASLIADDESLNAVEKIKRMILAQNEEIVRNHITLQQLHRIKNTDMHQKMIVESVLQFAPVLTKAIEQGILEGVFRTDYPLETMQFILTGSQFLFDPGIFRWTAEELRSKLKAMIWILEKSLCAKEGTFQYLTEAFEALE